MNLRAIICLLLASVSGWGQSHLKTPNSLWYLDNAKLTSDRTSALSAELPKWQAARVFDGFTWRLCPHFSGPAASHRADELDECGSAW